MTGHAAAPVPIRLSPGGFRLVFSDREPGPLKIAVDALLRDFSRVTPHAPVVVNALDDDHSTPALVIVNRASRALAVPSERRKALAGVESHRIHADAATNRVYLEGNDLRGTIYAIYSFSERFLGVPPLHFWSSWQPIVRPSVDIPGNCDLFFKSPQVRYRTFLPGDSDYFAPWRKAAPGNDAIWLETLLRLKLNTVEAYTSVGTGYRMSDYAQSIGRHGLILTSHHTSGLNTSFASWEAYWRQTRKMPVPEFRLSNRAALLEFFTYNAETVHRSGIENLWTLAFRGARDQPFWSIFEDAPTGDRERAAVIDDMVRMQLDVIKQVTGDPSPAVRMTFYDELADLLAKGFLQPPTGPNMIWTFVAARRDPYPYDDVLNFDARLPVRLGYYMNFGFASTGAHLTPAEGPWKMEFNYRYVNGKSPLHFSVVNAGCMREFLFELSAHAAMLWDFADYDSDRFTRAYCAQYFGEEHAAEIALLYRDYYRAYWEPKRPEFAGMERQFVFQDLRYARAFDHVARGFFATPGAPNLNPLRDIGYERVPGRTFRIDLRDHGAANQVEALIAGMESAGPRFLAVAARCTEIRAKLGADRQVFFNDNLRVYSYTMAHLSRALAEFLRAYRDQADAAALVRHLDQAEQEVQTVQHTLHETEHGIFSAWYRDAEAMTRTVQLDTWKSTIAALRKTAVERSRR